MSFFRNQHARRAAREEKPYQPPPSVAYRGEGAACPVGLGRDFQRSRSSGGVFPSVRKVWSGPIVQEVSAPAMYVYDYYGEGHFFFELASFLGGWEWWPTTDRPADITVNGNTYPHRRALALMGGTWDSDAKVWRVPQEMAWKAKRLHGVEIVK